MSIAFREIQTRHGKRCAIIRDSRGMKAPLLTDAESVKEHMKLIKDQQAELINECFLVDQDMQVLIVALNDIASPDVVESAVGRAWDKCFATMPPQDQEVYHRRIHEEIEKETKAAKERGDVPGQIKMFKDDGSTAEPAGPISSRKIKDAAKL